MWLVFLPTWERASGAMGRRPRGEDGGVGGAAPESAGGGTG